MNQSDLNWLYFACGIAGIAGIIILYFIIRGAVKSGVSTALFDRDIRIKNNGEFDLLEQSYQAGGMSDDEYKRKRAELHKKHQA